MMIRLRPFLIVTAVLLLIGVVQSLHYDSFAQFTGGGEEGTRPSRPYPPCDVSASCTSLGISSKLDCDFPRWCRWYWPLSKTLYDVSVQRTFCVIYEECGGIIRERGTYIYETVVGRQKIGCC